MDTLTDKVNVVSLALRVKFLVLLCKLAKKLVFLLEIVWIDNSSLQDLNARDIFTIIVSVFLCKDVPEES